MSNDTTTFAKDALGTKLVVGQSVFCTNSKRTGQLMGLVRPQETCTVRFNDTGEVVSLPASQLRVATWSDIRIQTGATLRIRSLPAADTPPA